MLHANPQTHELVSREQLQDCLRRAEIDRLCHEGAIERRGFSVRLACRMLAGVGCLLVSLGAALQRLQPTAAASVGEFSGAAQSR